MRFRIEKGIPLDVPLKRGKNVGTKVNLQVRARRRDLKYQEARNKLIPSAEANRVAGIKPNKGSTKELHELWANNWNQTFFQEMDRLWTRYTGWVMAQKRANRKEKNHD